MVSTSANAPLNLGFLTILQESNGYVGGYLVTNQWGRPLEFRLSSAVQPTRIQHILYGDTLQPYVCADLIGKTLVEKTNTTAQFVFTDREEALDLRLRLEIPVLWLAAQNQDRVRCHARYPQDLPIARELLARLEGTLELAEPFARIREAMGEARKMGVTSRA